MTDLLQQKHAKVTEWLERVFEDQPIPQYEMNSDTLNDLHMFAVQNQDMDQLVRFHIEDLRKKSEEYQAEGDNLRKLLENIGMPIYALSNAGKSSVKMLADTAVALNIKDCKKSSYVLAIADLKVESAELAEKIEQVKNETEQIARQTEDAINKLKQLELMKESMQQQSASELPVMQKRLKDIEVLSTKSDKYRLQISEYEAQNKNTGYMDNISHEALLQTAEKLAEMKAELKPIRLKLEGYHSLPPDVALAKVKIEEAKRQLEQLENQLQSDIDVLGL